MEDVPVVDCAEVLCMRIKAFERANFCQEAAFSNLEDLPSHGHYIVVTPMARIQLREMLPQ